MQVTGIQMYAFKHSCEILIRLPDAVMCYGDGEGAYVFAENAVWDSKPHLQAFNKWRQTWYKNNLY